MKKRVLTPKRTEYGKAIRKQYESGGGTGEKIKHGSVRTEKRWLM